MMPFYRRESVLNSDHLSARVFRGMILSTLTIVSTIGLSSITHADSMSKLGEDASGKSKVSGAGAELADKPTYFASSRAKNSNDTLDTVNPYASFRLGFVVSPTTSIQGGLDVTFPRLSTGRGWVTRVDGEFQAKLRSPSFGSRRDSVFSLNVCQVYSKEELSKSGLYFGGGLGLFIGPFKGTVGGKVFVGTHFSQTVSLEAQALFPGEATPQIAIGLRISVF